jgi:hypothetical protein
MCGANIPGSGIAGGGQMYNADTGAALPMPEYPYMGFYRTDPVTNKALPEEVARLTAGGATAARTPDTGPAAVPIAPVATVAPLGATSGGVLSRSAGGDPAALRKTLLGV